MGLNLKNTKSELLIISGTAYFDKDVYYVNELIENKNFMEVKYEVKNTNNREAQLTSINENYTNLPQWLNNYSI
ncbi:MAG: hypothetical protein ACD_79C00547G0001 [uncultured bacterium]|nr:MAG: hypothetical protein ACD_79C00547G0001 [uncultured bacterium]